MSANGATASFGWDGMKRQTSQTLPSGQVINHEYGLGQGPGASWHKVTTGLSPNFRWTKTVFDGFGRTLEVISGSKVGATETAVSKVVTEYTPCACSSIGKVKRTSMPFAANANPAHWTTYEYDEIGRTVKVTPPGNAGFTSYQYGGTTVKTIDAKGKWKKFENDALGNLITVWEPRPGGGADYVTSYTYTLLGKLNVVTMTRPGKGVGAPATVTQTRTYAYNSYGELQSVTHPENGTTQYEYFADGSLKKKTDAKSQRLEWTYDAEGRPVTVKRFWANGVEDVCARVTTTYGSQGLDGSFSGANLAGRLASVTTGCQYVPSGETETKGGRVDELYSYNSAGAVVTKRVRILRGNSTVTKDIGYTFHGEGKLATMQYPDEAKPYVMSYDAMARPSGMTQEYQLQGTPDWLNRNWVSGVSYGVAGQLLGMSWYGGGSSMFGETRTYNERLQLTRQQATGMDLEYVFTDGQNPMNDGRIIARINRLNTANPETVKYKYDELNRLIEAEQTSGPGAQTSWWGMTWDFDGFGNRWSQDQKYQRVGIPSSVTFDLGTNRVNSLLYGHDANGNMTAMPGVNGALIYDIDNRLTKVDRNGSHEQYRYLGDNKRYWKRTNQGGNVAEEYYLYGVGGQRIATYPASYNEQTSVLTVNAANKKLDVYFGGKVIWQNGRAVVQDRLGSVMARGNGSGGVETHDYYPYGEERVATVGDRNKFGTYHRDQTGLDYADQRFYNSAIGRFLTSDPAGSDTNWYRYSGNDPININDPSGLYGCYITVFVSISIPTSVCPPGMTFNEQTDPTPLVREVGDADQGMPAGFAWAYAMLGWALNEVQAGHRNSCVELFTLGTALDGGSSTSVLLHALLSMHTSGLNNLVIPSTADLGSTPLGVTNAIVTIGGGVGPGGFLGQAAFITFNTNSRSVFGDGSRRPSSRFGLDALMGPAARFVDQAVTIIHELGHVFNGASVFVNGSWVQVFGLSAIVDDTDMPDISSDNSKLVFDRCAMPFLRSMGFGVAQ